MIRLSAAVDCRNASERRLLGLLTRVAGDDGARLRVGGVCGGRVQSP